MAGSVDIAVASKAYKKEEIDYIALQCMSLITKKVLYNLTIKEMVLEYAHRRD